MTRAVDVRALDDRPGSVTWHVDDRSPTLFTRLYVRAMWLWRDKSAFDGAGQTLRTAERLQRSGDAAPTWWTRRTCRVREQSVAGQSLWRVGRHAPSCRVVYLHGGGYVHPLTTDYWRLVRALTHAGAEVVVPRYPLAPRHHVDEVLTWLRAVSSRVTGDGLPLVLMGDSAGGALALTLARSLARRGDGQVAPARVVLLCPWLDASLAGPDVARLEASDPMLAESGLRAAGRWWAGLRPPEDPLVSPVNAPLEGLAPVDVFIGDHDILRPAVDEFVDRLAEAGGAVCVYEVTAMFHVWMTRAVSEARRTRSQLAQLVRDTARSVA